MEVLLYIDLPDIGEMLGEEARGMLRDVTIRTADRMKAKHADGNPTGRYYRRGKSTVHRASAKGEPPAVDTGNLLGSVQAEFNERDLAGEISLNVYGWYLETGFERGDVKVDARPWIMPSLDEVMRDFQ